MPASDNLATDSGATPKADIQAAALLRDYLPGGRNAAMVESLVLRYRHLLKAEDLDDMRSQVYTAVWMALPKYDPDRSASVSTFVYYVVKSAARDFMRSRCKITRDPLDAAGPLRTWSDGETETIPAALTSDPWDAVDVSLTLDAILGRLSPKHRQVLTWRRLGLPYSYIARRLRISRARSEELCRAAIAAAQWVARG